MSEPAVIRDVRFGVGDRGRCWLQFEVRLGSSRAAMLILEVEEAVPVIEAYGVRDVGELDGRACYVECDQGLVCWSHAAPEL